MAPHRPRTRVPAIVLAAWGPITFLLAVLVSGPRIGYDPLVMWIPLVFAVVAIRLGFAVARGGVVSSVVGGVIFVVVTASFVGRAANTGEVLAVVAAVAHGGLAVWVVLESVRGALTGHDPRPFTRPRADWQAPDGHQFANAQPAGDDHQ